MILKFKKVQIQAFQSIDKATVDLDGQGVVLIKGVNLYEPKGSSNGSGKTSIAESILYAIYGKTSKGIASVGNRYSNKECMVTLDFLIDNQPYTIIRGEKGKNHKQYVELYKGEEDISARNKTDTDKYIESLLPFDRDIFLSTIFLSQNFSGKLSALTPSGRKDRIEIITNVAEKLEEFKNKLSKVKTNYSDKYTEKQKEVAFAEGKISYIGSQITSYENQIRQIESDLERLMTEENVDTDSLKEKMDMFNEQVSMFSEKSSQFSDKLNDITLLLSKKNGELQTSRYKYQQLKKEIDDLISGKPCPTCGRPMSAVGSHEVIAEKQNQLHTLEVEGKNLKTSYDSLIEKKNIITNKIRECNENMAKMRASISNISSLYTQATQANAVILANQDKKQTAEKELTTLKENVLVENENRAKASEQANEYEDNVNVASQSMQILTKQFRNYMLDNTINYLNELLEEYSKYIFGNDIISIVSDGSKLDIYLGDNIYESCSGGECKKVDIALVLAQRELGIRMTGVESNILIMDEILENLDATATESAIGLILEKCNCESLFMISHNQYSLPYDKEIIVVKDKSRTSKIQ